MNHQYEKYRMEETMSQQTKLIDFLQDKVESTPRKKKWVKLNVIFYTFFTALHVMQTRYSDENSVRLSVTRVDCDKTEERSVQIFAPYERQFILVY